jgi:hypothetical protein
LATYARYKFLVVIDAVIMMISALRSHDDRGDQMDLDHREAARRLSRWFDRCSDDKVIKTAITATAATRAAGGGSSRINFSSRNPRVARCITRILSTSCRGLAPAGGTGDIPTSDRSN